MGCHGAKLWLVRRAEGRPIHLRHLTWPCTRSLPFSRRLTTVLRMRPLLSRITVEPGKCGGRPCIRGYRLRVKDVMELLAQGASWEEILADYPFLETDDIRACLEFAD